MTALNPDACAVGLVRDALDPRRYDGHLDHPAEVAGMLRRFMPRRARVLDVGCGTGALTVLANRGRGNTVVCIEPDAERAAVARGRGLNVHTGELTEALLPYLGSFDVVMASDVLEHVADPAALLNLMRRAVRPGGYVLLSVPNVAHWSVRLALLFGRFDYEPVGIMDATHLRWFTEHTLFELVERCGLKLAALRQTAGSDLPVYGRGLLGRIPAGLKRPLIRAAARKFPRLFGVQHVVLAQVP